jgi:type II secretory pathway pseudopilin PulG
MKLQKGFTFIELIIYISISTIVISAMIPFAWNIILTGAKSGAQQEVFSHARYMSERIKYEIRNALGITSVSSTQIVLCETSGACATNPTTITYVPRVGAIPGKITLQRNGAASADNLNTIDLDVTSATFTNYTSADNKTKHIWFTFTVDDTGVSSRQEYKVTPVSIESSAEVRSN